MDLQDLGNIGEFVASIAVLLTLLFLTMETRRNTVAVSRANARHTAIQQANALGELLDGEVAEIFLKGQKSLDTLSELERYRFDLVFTIWLQSVEQAYQDYREGSFSPDSLVAYESSIPGFLTTPGGAAWWKERQVWFARSFREDVERLCAQAGVEAEKAGPRFSE